MASSGGLANWRMRLGRRATNRNPSEECSSRRPTASSGRWASLADFKVENTQARQCGPVHILALSSVIDAFQTSRPVLQIASKISNILSKIIRWNDRRTEHTLSVIHDHL